MAINSIQTSVVDGGWYFAKWGNNSNNGTTKDTPKIYARQTTSTAAGGAASYIMHFRRNVFVSGHYNFNNPTIGQAYTSSGNYRPDTFVGDGKVILENCILGHYTRYINIEFRNCAFESYAPQDYQSFRVIIDKCILKNVTGTVSWESSISAWICHLFMDSILLDNSFTWSPLTTPAVAKYYCAFWRTIIYNVSTQRMSRLVDCYVGSGIDIEFAIPASEPVPLTVFNSNLSTTTIQIGYSNIQGRILLQGTYYAVQDQLTGTPQDNGYGVGTKWLNETELTNSGYTGVISGWNNVVSTLMNRDPKFVDAPNGVFDLKSDSPHINASSTGGNIGPSITNVVSVFNVNDDGVGNKQVILSAEIDDTDPAEVFTTDPEGTVRFIDYIPGSVGKLKLDSDLNFNSDFNGGTADNNNVPDAQPTQAGYASKALAVAAGTTTTYIVANADAPSIGNYVRTLGQLRTVTNVQTDVPIAGQTTVTLSSALLAATILNQIITFGVENDILLLSPNRLTYLMRASSNDSGTPPTVEADWDNLGFGTAEVYYVQEVGAVPGIIQVGGNYYGAGDVTRPAVGVFRGFRGCWIDVKIVLNNYYNHDGLA